MVEGAGDAKTHGDRRLGLDRQIREHVPHDRLIDQLSPESASLRAMVDRLAGRHPQPRRGAEHAIETRQGDHFDDRRHAAAFLADHPGESAAQLGFAGGVGGVGAFFLQPQHLHRVFFAVGPPARQQETGQAARRLRQGQEKVAHRRRNEKLVSDQFIGLAWPLDRNREGASRVGANVRASLFFGHGHAERQALLLGRRDIARVIDAGCDFGQPVVGKIGLRLKAASGGEGHGNRTAMARLDLRMHEEPCGAGDVRARRGVRPGRRMESFFNRGAHQRVIGGVKADLVDPPAVSIMRIELRQIMVGERAEFQMLGRADPRPETLQVVDRPLRAFSRDRFPQRAVRRE